MDDLLGSRQAPLNCASVTITKEKRLGWPFEISRYRNRIQHILSNIKAAQLEVLPENNASVLTYMDDWYMAQMAAFVDAAKEEKRPGNELVRLVETNMSHLETKWTRLLEPSSYGIDSVDSVVQLSSGYRAESVSVLFRNNSFQD